MKATPAYIFKDERFGFAYYLDRKTISYCAASFPVVFADSIDSLLSQMKFYNQGHERYDIRFQKPKIWPAKCQESFMDLTNAQKREFRQKTAGLEFVAYDIAKQVA